MSLLETPGRARSIRGLVPARRSKIDVVGCGIILKWECTMLYEHIMNQLLFGQSVHGWLNFLDKS